MEALNFKTKHVYLATQFPISLRHASRPVRLIAKVDTGAEFCIFQRDYAEQLGIHVESGKYQEMSTAAGRFDTYGHTVHLSCFEWEFEAMVYFAAWEGFNRNVVGRNGWLQHFRLGLVDHDSTLYLSHYDD